MDPYASQAYLLFKADKFQESLVLYSKYIDEAPDNAQIYSERAVVYFHLKQFTEALNDCNTAVELNPGNAYRYASRAFIKDAMGNTAGAVEDYETALALDPNDAVSYNNLGLLQEKLGYIEKAKRNYSKADEIAEQENLFLSDDSGVEQTLQTSAQKANSETEEPVLGPPEKKENVAKIAAEVFTKKSVFKEFVQFVKNGFKL